MESIHNSEDSQRIAEIHKVVTTLSRNQQDCMDGFKKNQDTMEHILDSLDRHLTHFGSNLDKLTDRLDRVLSQGMIPVMVLKWIVISFITVAFAFVLITLFFVLGWDGVQAFVQTLTHNSVP